VCVVKLIVRNGKIINREHFIIKKYEDDDIKSIVTDFVKQHYSMQDFIPKNICLSNNIDDRELIEKWLSEKCKCKIKIQIPQKGENKKLIDMAKNNAVETLKLHILNHDIKHRKMSDLIYKLKDILNLENPPMRIESYDISNISGADSVGACVVFENGIPKKSAYRLFNIKSVNGANDYESIKETLYRRLENGIEGTEGFELPDLILIDGGKGHVKAAKEIVNFYNLDIPVFGMVKDDKHKTRGLTTDNDEISIKKTDPLFKFITNIQDETHRFAITSFRKKHKKTQLKSQLLDIDGIGEAKKNLLLKHFKTVKAIKSASIAEISEIIDSKTAENVFNYFNSQN
ncbi:MAG: excinuclease ABC subunit C, partial [Clostridia bacterium]|nr:excinuclease ABC subunit C [Clostridia bacterium]